MISYSQWREILQNERLPAVVVDLDAFDRNVAKLGGIVKSGSKRLRLATKSLRVPSLILRVLKAGAPFKGLMCYSSEEVEFLSELGLKDFLVAYPTAQAHDLKILRQVHERGAEVRLIVDSVAGIERVAKAMDAVKTPFPVVIDVDVSLKLFWGLVHLGVRRSPVRTAQDVSKLLDSIARFPQLKAAGAMAYEAQVAGLGDRNPFKALINPFARLIRTRSVRTVARTREEVAKVFKDRGIALELFNGGGTGSVNYAVAEAALTELSAGSGLLCSHLFDYYSNIQFEPACFFALQVTRVPAPGMVTCLGGGYVASGEPGWDKVPVPYLPKGSKLVSMEGTGEVQTPLQLGEGATVGLGDLILFRHAKAGELAERFNEYLLVSNGKIVERVKTYRGFGKSFC